MWRIWETRESWSCLVSQLCPSCVPRGGPGCGAVGFVTFFIYRENSYLFSFKQCWAASMITSYQEKIITLIIVISSMWQMKANCANAFIKKSAMKANAAF